MASSPPPSPVAGPSRQSLDAASASAKKPGRRKLPEEAAEVLSNFFENVSTTPSPGQRKELLAQVTRIPGAEWYSFKNISKWFTSHKKRRSDDDASEAEELGGGTDRILWPSLDISKIRNLKVLLNETPAPTPVHLLVWSRTLGAEQQHVENWVQLHRAQLTPQSHPHEQGQRHDSSALPTPEGTASPELQSPLIPTPSSPIASSNTTVQATYVGYGAPAYIGPIVPYAVPPTSFITVQPSSYAIVSSKSRFRSPGTPTSPVQVPSPPVFAVLREDSPEMDANAATAEEEEEVDELRTPTPLSGLKPPFEEPLLPPDTPSDVGMDENENEDAEIAEVEAMAQSFSRISDHESNIVEKPTIEPPTPECYLGHSLSTQRSHLPTPDSTVVDEHTHPSTASIEGGTSTDISLQPISETEPITIDESNPTLDSLTPHRIQFSSTGLESIHTAPLTLPDLRQGDGLGTRALTSSSLPRLELRFSSPMIPADLTDSLRFQTISPITPTPSLQQTVLPPTNIPLVPSEPLLEPTGLSSGSPAPSSIPAQLPPHPQPTKAPQSSFWGFCDVVRAELDKLEKKTPSPPPTTFEELARRLEPTAQFWEAIKRGDYAHMGLVPSNKFSDHENEGERGIVEENQEMEDGEIMDVDG